MAEQQDQSGHIQPLSQLSVPTPSNPSVTTPTTDQSAAALMLMMQMQRQQLAMQEQMTQLFSKFAPTLQQPNDSQNRQRVKLERPYIEADSSDNKWVIFTDAWTRYKQMAKLEDVSEIRNDLRSACSSSVN